MNKFERQSRQPADQQTLPEVIAGDLSQMRGEVIDISDAPSIAPKPPLTQREVRTILMSLLLTMFLAALDQTIVATALPTIGRQFGDVTNLSWVITAYLLASTAVAPVFGTLSDIAVRRGLGDVRAGAEHAGADRRARPAGPWRRRHPADRADGDFRCGDAARARPVPGLLQRRLGRGRHRRPDPRWAVRRTPA